MSYFDAIIKYAQARSDNTHETFFLSPKDTYTDDHNLKGGFKNSPLGINSYDKIMIHGFELMGEKWTYSIYGCRGIVPEILLRRGIPLEQVIMQTGHWTIKGIQPYLRQIAAQLKTEQNQQELFDWVACGILTYL